MDSRRIVCTTPASKAIGDGGIKAGRINSNSLRGRTAGSTSEPFKAIASGIGHG